jgi:hypothetical protein
MAKSTGPRISPGPEGQRDRDWQARYRMAVWRWLDQVKLTEGQLVRVFNSEDGMPEGGWPARITRVSGGLIIISRAAGRRVGTFSAMTGLSTDGQGERFEPEIPCWADPLTRSERAELARMLARNCQRFGEAARHASKAIRHSGRRPSVTAIVAVEMLRHAGIEMADLRLDVTERAALPERVRDYGIEV